jgi:hypothetical protein
MQTRLEPTFNRLSDCTRHNDPTWRRFSLEPRSDVHAVTVEVVTVDDQIAEMQAEADFRCLGVRDLLSQSRKVSSALVSVGAEIVTSLAAGIDPATTRNNAVRGKRPWGRPPNCKAPDAGLLRATHFLVVRGQTPTA